MFDMIIQGGLVLDGSGINAVSLDIGIQDGKIAAMGRLKDAEALELIGL